MISETQKELVLKYLQPLKPFKIGIFGSYARNENDSKSDLDVLVHLDYSQPISLLKLINVELNLSEALGISVDLVTEGSLSPHLRPYIEKDLIYIF
jgi:hypothetical protein